jgi:hypothetical protein
MLTGSDQPWNAEGKHYLWAVFFAGLGATLLFSKAFWVAPFGVCAGQIVYGIYFHQPDGDAFWWIGMVMAVIYCVVALAGAIAGAFLSLVFRAAVGTISFVAGLWGTDRTRDHRGR